MCLLIEVILKFFLKQEKHDREMVVVVVSFSLIVRTRLLLNDTQTYCNLRLFLRSYTKSTIHKASRSPVIFGPIISFITYHYFCFDCFLQVTSHYFRQQQLLELLCLGTDCKENEHKSIGQSGARE